MHDRSVHIFDIYEHPERGLRAIRRGFSWVAFLMPSVWAVRRDLGWTTLGLFVLTTAAFDLARFGAGVGLGPVTQLVVLIALLLVLGLLPATDGYRWHADALRQRGYVHRNTVAARSKAQALRAAAQDRFDAAPILVAAA